MSSLRRSIALTRRAFLEASGVAAAGCLAAWSGSAFAATGRDLLLDGALSPSELADLGGTLDLTRGRRLNGDLVWAWRNELREHATRYGAIAVTRWDKAVIFGGLAREARLPLRQHRIGAVFLADIGPLQT